MAENKKPRNTLKILESVGKEVLTGVLCDLVEKDVLKLEEEERKKFEEANPREKTRVLVNSICQKRHVVGEVLLQTFLNTNKNHTQAEVPPGLVTKPPESGETTDVLKLCPHEEFLRISKERAGEDSQVTTQDMYKVPFWALERSLFIHNSSCVYPVHYKEGQRLDLVLLDVGENTSANLHRVTVIGGEFHRDALNSVHCIPILQIYPIKEKTGRSRLALIICNTEFDQLSHRRGAEHDIRGMRGLLESLDYTVEVKEHLTAKGMEDALREFAARHEHRTSDSTFLVFMSHGALEGICGIKHSDENPDMLPNDTIFQIFNTHNCPLLKDKPKVIITQTCRGEKLGATVVSDSPGASADSSSPENIEDDAVCRTHVEKDFIAFYSSTPHTKSWRDTMRGSYFIIELITCFKNYAWCCHLLEIFQKVQQSFEKRCDQFQMPTIERLNMPKCFYLFPGN